MQSILNISRSGRRFRPAALALSLSLTALLFWAGAAPAAPAAHAPCTITGTEGPDVIHGTPGDDVICGFGHVDQLYGEGGNDVLRGGGRDWVWGSCCQDSMDHLYGGTGRDLLDGGDGYDRLHGGSGADVFRGGAGGDMVLYWGQRKPVTITIGDGPNDGTAGERDDVEGDIEYMSGGKGDDTLIGNGEANNIFGYGGNDRLVGGPGYDGLWGGEGDDTLDVSGDLDKDGARCGDGLDTLVSDQFDRKPFIGQQCEIFL